MFKHPGCRFSALSLPSRNRYTIAACSQALTPVEGREELTPSPIGLSMYDV